MVMNKKLFKQKVLIIFDMLICLVCALFVSIFFYRVKLIDSMKIELIILSVILLPLTMAVSMIIFKGYKKHVKNTTIEQLNIYIRAIFFCVIIYSLEDMIFGYYDMAVCKIISAIVAGFFIIQMRIMYIQLASKKDENESIESIQENKNIIRINSNDNSDKEFIDMVLDKYQSNLDETKVNRFYLGKSIMVIGGAGYIGSNLVKKLASYECKRIIVVDIDENALYNLKKFTNQNFENSIEIIYEIASVRDYKRMDVLFEKYRPDIVYHGAIHKNIELVEKSSAEAVKNNIFGAYTCAKLADIYRVDRFVLLSSNEVADAKCVVSSTKRISELIMQYMAMKTKCTKYTSLRFSQVLGSKGSELEIFKEQIRNGGPITVAHKDITRIFTRVESVIEGVIHSTMLTKNNDIYVLQQGKELSIKDMGRKYIRYNGFKYNKDIKIEYTGLELGEVMQSIKPMGELETEFDNLLCIKNENIETGEFYKKLNLLNVVAKENDKDNVQKIIDEILLTYDKGSYMTIESIEAIQNTEEIALRAEEFYDAAL